MLEYLIIFLFGLAIGSFLNVLIFRIPEGKSIVFPSSHCMFCNHSLQVFDLIPVLSFLLLRGRCRYCGERISRQYPLVELLTGLVLLPFYHKFGLSTVFFIYSILVFTLIVISVIDFKLKIIPNKITYPGIILALILSLIFNHISFIPSLLGIIIPAGLFLLVALIYQKGLGMGDVKLVAMIGAVLGWQYTLLGVVFGSIIGLIIIFCLMMLKKFKPRQQIPFGTFISIGTVLVILYGEEIVRAYLGHFL